MDLGVGAGHDVALGGHSTEVLQAVRARRHAVHSMCCGLRQRDAAGSQGRLAGRLRGVPRQAPAGRCASGRSRPVLVSLRAETVRATWDKRQTHTAAVPAWIKSDKRMSKNLTVSRPMRN